MSPDRLCAKRAIGRLPLARARAGFPVPQLIRRGFHRNVPEQEKFGALVAAGRANAVMVYLASEVDRPLPLGYAYWSRDAAAYRPTELPCRSPRAAQAALFVLDLLLRNWDDCEGNRAHAGGLPILFDFGDIGNPNLRDPADFCRPLAWRHPAGHHAQPFLYARRFSAADRPHLEAALAAFEDLGDGGLQRLGALSGASRRCPTVVAEARACLRTLRTDAAAVIARCRPDEAPPRSRGAAGGR